MRWIGFGSFCCVQRGLRVGLGHELVRVLRHGLEKLVLPQRSLCAPMRASLYSVMHIDRHWAGAMSYTVLEHNILVRVCYRPTYNRGTRCDRQRDEAGSYMAPVACSWTW